MAIRIVQLGSPRHAGEGLRLGTVRRPPRGVPKADFARRDFYDVWMPDLAPSAPTLSWVHVEPMSPERWRRFAGTYRREMGTPEAKRLIGLLAALSHRTDLSVGCYCEDSATCHRSVLRELLVEAGAHVV